MSGSLSKKVGIASLVMMASVFLSRIIGVVREMVIAGLRGVGADVDAYQVAFLLPEILNHLVASGFLSLTFIPIFSGYLARGREEDGWRTFSVILTWFGLLLLCLVVIAEVFTEPLMRMVAPGIQAPATLAAIVKMTRIILPAQLFFFAGGLFMAVQFAKERFFLPALAPLVYNLGIIAGGLLLARRCGIIGFSWGVLAGAFAGNFLLQGIGARRAGMRFTPSLALAHPDLKKYVRLTLPLMVGLTPAFSVELLFRFFGSYLAPGTISGINYSLRLTLVVYGLFGQALATAFFPFMSRLVAEDNLSEANRLLNRTLRHLTLALPGVAVLMVLRGEVVALLFQRGAFDVAATAFTARVLVPLLPGAVALAAYTLVLRGFYARQNTLFPAVFSTVAVVVTLPAYFLFMRWWGAQGIALALTCSTTGQALLLAWVWNRRSGNTGGRVVAAAFCKMTLVALAVGGVLEWLRRLVAGELAQAGAAGQVAIVGICGAAGLLMVVGIGRVTELREIQEPIGLLREALFRRLRLNR